MLNDKEKAKNERLRSISMDSPDNRRTRQGREGGETLQKGEMQRAHKRIMATLTQKF